MKRKHNPRARRSESVVKFQPARRKLRAELLEQRMLLAAQLSPSPTIVPIFSPEDAVVLTSPVINDWEEYELSNGDRVENDFPFAEDDDGDGPADAPLTNDDTFRLHSNPDSTYKIFLDFDGAITENTNWNNGTGIPTLIDIAYDRNSNPGVFNNSELNQIREIWRLVAEDYAPFDVDVTTEDPGTEALRRANGTDFEYGIRSIHTSNTNQVCSGCGGVAYVGSFDSASDLPAYNFNKGINGGGNTQSHEIGHAVSLSHDGLTGGTTYYSGHGTGDTAWAPIMGSSFGTKITTFSNGDYFNANQQQDDLNRIVSQNGFGYRDDDHGNTFAVATPLQISGRTGLSSFGIIERNTDVDLFSFETAAGNVSFTISPHENYQNLDVWAGIYDAAGLLVAESNPSGNTTASFSNVTLAAGKYFLKVEGVGTHGFYNAALDKVIDPGEVDYTGPETTVPWDVSGPVGYSDYASLGQYWITGTRAAAATNLISIAPQDSEKSEGTSGSTPFTFRVSRLGAGGSSVQVDYAVVTASPEADNNVQPFTVSPADFVSGTLETGVITIPAGQPSVDFTIDVAGDSVFERDEHFQVVISNPTSGWTISDSVADATILSDESSHGVASINTADSTKEEGDPSTGAASYTYTLFRRGDTSVTTSANWQVQYGGFSNAANNADFAGGVRPQGTVTFSPGETEKQIDILLAADLDVEGDESFSVVVTGASGPNTALVDSGTPSQRGIIFEDESPVSVIDQVQFRWRQNRNGSNNADAWAIDNVSLSGTSFSEDFDPSIDASLWADLENANVNSSTTIFPGSDGNKLLMRGSGDRVATTVGLQPTSGAVLSFDIILGDGTGANGNGADNVENGKFIILEYSVDGQNWDFLRRMNPNDFETWSTVDVTLPARAILTPKVITEGDGGSQSVQFNIVRTGNRGKTASADWQVVPSGVNPIDLDDVGGVYPSGTVNFGLNDGVEVVTVPIVGDLIPESDETFDIIVTSANSGPITGGPRTITIVNDDAPSVDSVIINEGAVTRSAVTKVEVVFDTLVDAPPSAFSLTNLGTTASPGSTPVTGLAISSDSTGPVTIVSISLVSGGSLADGNYRLDIDGSQVSAIAGGLGMAGDYVYGDDAADDFFRRYGDSNGDGSVNFTDFSQHFLPAFATTQAGAGAAFRWDLDLNEDGAVNFTDFSNGFLPNFATSR